MYSNITIFMLFLLFLLVIFIFYSKMKFNNIVIIISIYLLLIIFIGLIYSIYKNNKNIRPLNYKQVCPDYWIDPLKNGSQCINYMDLGTCKKNDTDEHLIMDFTSSEYTSNSGDCFKYKWAKKCNVAWDGITYGVQNPCKKNIYLNSTTNSSVTPNYYN